LTEKPSKDEALEALDFIVNVLKEHEKDLDRLVNELGTVAGQLGESGELSGKVRKIEDKINGLQNDVGNLVNSLSTLPLEPSAPRSTPTGDKVQSALIPQLVGARLIFHCKHWEDFLKLAVRSQTVSFLCKDSGKAFEVFALNSSQVVVFSGDMPVFSDLLKTYLSKRLEISEQSILEGEIALK
jgi:hypothetical protein